MTEVSKKEEMGVFNRIIGIFISPKETFESIDQKPTWFVPLLIAIIIAVGLMFVTMDINMKDQQAAMDYRIASGELSDQQVQQIEASSGFSQGIGKYIPLIITPIYYIVISLIWAGIFLFAGNTVMGGKGVFKKVFSVVAWSSLVGSLGFILNRVLVMMKGTNQGVSTSLAALLPAPQMGETPTFLYRLLGKFDIFRIWELALWIIGFAVIFKFTNKKSTSMVITVFVIWTVIALGLGQLLGGMFGS